MALNKETIEKLPASQKALIVVVVIIIIYALYYVLWVSDKKEIIKAKTKTLNDKRSEIAKGKSVLQDIEHFRGIQAKLQLELKEAEKKLPKQAEIPELLEKISDLARGSLLVFPTFHPDLKPTPGGGGLYQQISIQVTFQGEYQRIAQFLDQISKLERIINVDNLSLDPTRDSSTIKASVKLITFMFGG